MKRNDAPIFSEQYLEGLRRLSEGGDLKHLHPFAPGGLAFTVITKARVTFHHQRDECLSAKPGTQLWYSGKIAGLADALEAAVGEGRVRDVATEAFCLGLVVREMSIQGAHGGAIEVHAEHTDRISTVAAESKERAHQKAKVWQAEADKHWAKNSQLTNSGVAKKIADRIGGNVDTIRKAIRKPGK
jgi:hypothetical protein